MMVFGVMTRADALERVFMCVGAQWLTAIPKPGIRKVGTRVNSNRGNNLQIDGDIVLMPMGLEIQNEFGYASQWRH